jgi:hypothetical protein
MISVVNREKALSKRPEGAKNESVIGSQCALCLSARFLELRRTRHPFNASGHDLLRFVNLGRVPQDSKISRVDAVQPPGQVLHCHWRIVAL